MIQKLYQQQNLQQFNQQQFDQQYVSSNETVNDFYDIQIMFNEYCYGGDSNIEKKELINKLELLTRIIHNYINKQENSNESIKYLLDVYIESINEKILSLALINDQQFDEILNNTTLINNYSFTELVYVKILTKKNIEKETIKFDANVSKINKLMQLQTMVLQNTENVKLRQ